MSDKYHIKQVKSSSGQTKRLLDTLSSIGLGRIGKSAVLSSKDPAVIGKLKKVQHLVEIREAN